MNTQYFCKNKGRRKAVKNLKDTNGKPIIPTINGIDYLEVISMQKVSGNKKTKLKVYFLHELSGPGSSNPVPLTSPPTMLTSDNVIIEGGVRIKNINVKVISSDRNILELEADEWGDFSLYILRIVQSNDIKEPPKGFDPILSSVEFSFKAGCPSEFDCKIETVCPPEKLIELEVNYLAKDYASFRRLMLDRLSTIMPDWRERNPADMQIALVELLAYVGDHLSYYQDAVATEAYLGTARRRVSVKRHARLLDHVVHDGCNARTWVCFEVEKRGGAEGQTLPVGTRLLTNGSDNNEQPIIFETMHELTLYSSHNKISFYTWRDSECCLPRGSTHASLLNEPKLYLEKGDLLVFEEVVGPTTGTEADADPNHRHTVRLKRADAVVDPLTNKDVLEIEWYEKDALPFPLCLTAKVTDANGAPKVRDVSVARGNVVLADHGQTIDKKSLVPTMAPDDSDFRPQLQHIGVTVAVPYDHKSAKSKAAAAVLLQDPHKALPSVWLGAGEEKWKAQRDLLGSDRFAKEFVVEIERDGTAQLRFGDDILGKKPSAGFASSATYRIGNGRNGNIGAEKICCVESDFGGIDRVRNPMPVTGGKNAETMEEVRQFAPHAFRIQERAVTEADYARVTQLHSEVQKALALFRWTGSWYTVFVTIDRKGGWEVTNEFKAKIRRHLEKYRLAGYDLEINSPVFIPLDILMMVCVKPAYFKSHVKELLLMAFSRYDLDDDTRGFFHPDNFTFGQPVYLSQIYKYAMEVAGVASVEVVRFQRWGKNVNQEIEYGVLTPADCEIVRLDNDPNFPENGRIDFEMHGGL